VWIEATNNDDGHGGEPAGVDTAREPISVDTTGEPAFVSRRASVERDGSGADKTWCETARRHDNTGDDDERATTLEETTTTRAILATKARATRPRAT